MYKAPVASVRKISFPPNEEENAWLAQFKRDMTAKGYIVKVRYRGPRRPKRNAFDTQGRRTCLKADANKASVYVYRNWDKYRRVNSKEMG